MGSDTVLSPKQVAKILGVHDQTVKRISPADLPYYRFGTRGDRKYLTADVETYLKNRRVCK